MESLLAKFDGSHFLLLVLDRRVTVFMSHVAVEKNKIVKKNKIGSLSARKTVHNTHRVHFVEVAEHCSKISCAALPNQMRGAESFLLRMTIADARRCLLAS
jgi:hypothetical protein